MNKVYKALQSRYSGDGYIVLPEVNNGVGSVGGQRYADFVVLSLWPSRGLDIIGFERKTRRSDWLSEYKNPRKSDLIYSYCDSWYLITDTKDVAKKEEIPRTWGWMYLKNGRTLHTAKKAPQKESSPTRAFYFSMLRNAHRRGEDEASAKTKDAYNRGQRDQEAKMQWDREQLEQQKASVEERERILKSMEADLLETPFSSLKEASSAIKLLSNSNRIKGLWYDAGAARIFATKLEECMDGIYNMVKKEE